MFCPSTGNPKHWRWIKWTFSILHGHLHFCSGHLWQACGNPRKRWCLQLWALKKGEIKMGEHSLCCSPAKLCLWSCVGPDFLPWCYTGTGAHCSDVLVLPLWWPPVCCWSAAAVNHNMDVSTTLTWVHFLHKMEESIMPQDMVGVWFWFYFF